MSATAEEVESLDLELSESESAELRRCEEAVDKGRRHYIETGIALRRIRDSRPKLYRKTHDTFEDYVRDRFEMSPRRAYQFIEAAEVAENLHNCAEKAPANEGQARELVGLAPEKQVEVWRDSLATAPSGRVTASHVAGVRSRHDPDASDEDEAGEAWNLFQQLVNARDAMRRLSEKWPSDHRVALGRKMVDLGQELINTGEIFA